MQTAGVIQRIKDVQDRDFFPITKNCFKKERTNCSLCMPGIFYYNHLVNNMFLSWFHSLEGRVIA